MGSTRLPGKVMLDLGGVTVLARVVERLRRAHLVGELVIATTTDPADDVIVRECESLGVQTFRGAEKDVLDRYYQAALHFNAEAVVRITSDCPLIDPEITDNVIRVFLDQRPDYASNALQRTYPRGLDTEAIAFEALERTWRLQLAAMDCRHTGGPEIHSLGLRMSGKQRGLWLARCAGPDGSASRTPGNQQPCLPEGTPGRLVAGEPVRKS